MIYWLCKLLVVLNKREDEINNLKNSINELKETIKRYPFILEKNENMREKMKKIDLLNNNFLELTKAIR